MLHEIMRYGMAVKDRVLSLLEENRGTYISGEQIAKQIDVSRAAVWKAIKRLQDEGFSIEGINNKGYQLSQDTDILSKQGIEQYIINKDFYNLEVYKTVTSTNLLLKERSHEAEGLVIAASEQTNGMGRLGRTFVSPKDTGIYFSILLKPKFDNREITLLTAIAAVAVCEAIEKYSDDKPKIKWVNDVFIGTRKVCGILTQASFSVENLEPEYVIVGIGINLYQPGDGFGKDVDKIAGAVFDTQEGNIKNKILAEVLNRYAYYYMNFREKKFVEEYRKRSLVLGKKISVIKTDKTREAMAIDIDDLCHLLVEYDDHSTEWLSTGEISIRLKA